jgi:cytochrome c biogenesis protein CcmG/thiol:disulfide interchange protein DsbE
MVSLLLLPLLVTGAMRPHLGDPAPAFVAKTLAGESLRSESLQGQVTVLEFFASWCEPCQQSLSEILTIRERRGLHFKLVVVAVEGDVVPLRKFLANHPLPEGTAVVLDGDGMLARMFGEERLPTAFFLDEKAILRHINRGHGSGFRDRITLWLSDMLAMPARPGF